MLIAHISDLHIKTPNQKAYGIVPTDKNLTKSVEHINQLYPAPDVVLVTGDITGNALKEEMEYAASILKKLKYPYFVIPGNHDNPNDVFAVFGEKHCPVSNSLASNNGFVNYVVDDFPIRLIGLDSTVKGASGGEFCEIRASWLKQCLDKETKKPTILFIHHPSIDVGVRETHEDGFVGADLLGDVVEKHSNIKRILCGHIHLNCHITWRGTMISTAPSMGLRLVLDLSLEMESQFVKDDPGYLLHYWSPEENLMTYSKSLHKTSEACFFEEA